MYLPGSEVPAFSWVLEVTGTLLFGQVFPRLVNILSLLKSSLVQHQSTTNHSHCRNGQRESSPLTYKHRHPCTLLPSAEGNRLLTRKASAFTCALNPVLSHLSRDLLIVFAEKLVTNSPLLNRMKSRFRSPAYKSFQDLAWPISTALPWLPGP